MKRFALLSTLCLFTGLSVAHASAFNPLADGYGIAVGNTTLSSTNVTTTSNGLTFTDATGTYLFAEVNLAPWVNALSVTRTCVLVNLGATCASQTVSVSNASLLNGVIQTSLALGVSATAGAQAGVTDLAFAGSIVSISGQTAIVGTQSSSLPVNSPVPEPGTISLVLSGALGVAAAARRRLLGA